MSEPNCGEEGIHTGQGQSTVGKWRWSRVRRASTQDRVGGLGNWRMRKEALPSMESQCPSGVIGYLHVGGDNIVSERELRLPKQGKCLRLSRMKMASLGKGSLERGIKAQAE